MVSLKGEQWFGASIQQREDMPMIVNRAGGCKAEGCKTMPKLCSKLPCKKERVRLVFSRSVNVWI